MARHRAHAVKIGNPLRRKARSKIQRRRELRSEFRKLEQDGWFVVVNNDHPPLAA